MHSRDQEIREQGINFRDHGMRKGTVRDQEIREQEINFRDHGMSKGTVRMYSKWGMGDDESKVMKQENSCCSANHGEGRGCDDKRTCPGIGECLREQH